MIHTWLSAQQKGAILHIPEAPKVSHRLNQPVTLQPNKKPPSNHFKRGCFSYQPDVHWGCATVTVVGSLIVLAA
ncbi:hypothetical protein [Kaistella solincola]|uniref:hypothetical protein n=1 Tax=Kaistella solincola TaxID=510955 RepID=UPI0012EB6E8A|nr:hypothetical protein [Kaistella solincola]